MQDPEPAYPTGTAEREGRHAGNGAHRDSLTSEIVLEILQAHLGPPAIVGRIRIEGALHALQVRQVLRPDIDRVFGRTGGGRGEGGEHRGVLVHEHHPARSFHRLLDALIDPTPASIDLVLDTGDDVVVAACRSEEHTSELQSQSNLVCRLLLEKKNVLFRSDRKSTRLNSSHSQISYAVFCLKKKNKSRNAGSMKTATPFALSRTTAESTTLRHH